MTMELLTPSNTVLKQLAALADDAIRQFPERAFTSPEAKYGLFDGKTGSLIVCQVLLKYTGQEYWKEMAADLIGELMEELGSVKPLGYTDGTAGIGWGIEWLIQNGLFSANSDDVLEDFDDNTYKMVLFSMDKTISLENGTLSKGAYFLKRYQGINFQTNRFKVICHQECLVLLTDELYAKVPDTIDTLAANPFEHPGSLADLADAIVFLSKMTLVKVNVETVEDALYMAVGFAGSLLEKMLANKDLDGLSHDVFEGLIRLAYACRFAGLNLFSSAWEKMGKKCLDILLDRWLECAFDPRRIILLPIVARLYHDTGETRYVETFFRETAYLDLHNLEARLDKGFYTVLLSVIGLLDKTLMGWDEALLLS